MVVLPVNFVATRYPGYFWNVTEKKLYSLKITGELKPMAFFKGGTFYGVRHDPGYKISVNGQRRKYTMDYLNTLKATTNFEEIGVKK